MIKKTFLTIILFCNLFCNSQEIDTSNKINIDSYAETFAMDNDSLQNSTLFVKSESYLKAYLFDAKKNFQDSLVAPVFSNKYSLVEQIGSKKGNILIWYQRKTDAIVFQTFDFANKNVSTLDVTVDLKNNNLFKTFIKDGKLYALSTIKESNNLKIDIVSVSGKWESIVIDLSAMVFYSAMENPITLYEIIGKYGGMFIPKSLPFIEKDSNLNLLVGMAERKLYLSNNKLVFTFDLNKNYTQVLKIDLNGFAASSKNYDTPVFDGVGSDGIAFVKTNSFFIDDKLIQFKVNSEKEVITVKNMAGEILNTYTLTPSEAETDHTYFKKYPSDDSPELLKNSKVFLRKLSNYNNAGLFVEKYNDQYYMTFGGISEEQQSAFMMFGLVGALIQVAVEAGSSKNLSAYSKREVVFTTLKFDEKATQFVNYKPNFSTTAMDDFILKTKRISRFSTSKIGGKVVLGYYKFENKTYNFKSF
jgi:hypothetical protein